MKSSSHLSHPAARRRWILAACVAVPLVMLFFAFVIYPIGYSLFCRVTGSGNATVTRVDSAPTTGTGRFVDVLFTAQVFDDLNVRFYPDKTSTRVEVGREGTNIYHFKNLSDHRVRFRPIHKVSPSEAAQAGIFKMLVCFCFNDQTMEAGETKDFPVTYLLDPSLDPKVGSIVLGYSLHRIDESKGVSEERERLKDELKGEQGVVTPGFGAHP